MDSQHRHELQENDLQQFLANFGQFWKKHGTTILVVVLVMVAAITGKRLWDARTRDRHERLWREMATATSPEVFRTIADEHGDPQVRALARLRAADLVLQRAAQAAASEEGDAQAAEADLQTAALNYEAVMRSKAHPLYQLNAAMGLATVAEARGDWTEAQTLWRQVKKDALTYPSIAAQAQSRLDALPRLQRPVIFAAEPPEPPESPDAAETSEAPAAPEAGAATQPGAPAVEQEAASEPSPMAPAAP